MDYPKLDIRRFLGEKEVKTLFIPYAAVTFSFDLYLEKVQERFREIGHQADSIHHFDDPVQAILDAEAIVVFAGDEQECSC